MSADTTRIPTEPVCIAEESTTLSWNGTCPESPDGTHLVYTRLGALARSLYYNGQTVPAELWVCRTDLTGHRKLFEFHGINHNGSMASWVDDSRIAFLARRQCEKDYSHLLLEPANQGIPPELFNRMADIYVIDARTGDVRHGPICGSIGHEARNGCVYFGVLPQHLADENCHPAVDEGGIYALDCDSGAVRKIVATSTVKEFLLSLGYTDPEDTLAHVNANPSGTRVMARWGMKKDGRMHRVLLSHDMDGRDMVITETEARPFHQLWYDDETYMACSRGEGYPICRYDQRCRQLEVLGGLGNHFDGSADRRYYVSDSVYRCVPLEIWLYERGRTEPIARLARFDGAVLTFPVWSLKAHANPVFSRDGRSVYYTRPALRSLEQTPVNHADLFKIEAVKADVSAFTG